MLAGIWGAILPGFREVRTTFVCGALWVCTAWVALDLALVTRETATGVWADAYALSDYLGRPTTILLVSVGVYLVGVIIEPAILGVANHVRRYMRSRRLWMSHLRGRRAFWSTGATKVDKNDNPTDQALQYRRILAALPSRRHWIYVRCTKKRRSVVGEIEKLDSSNSVVRMHVAFAAGVERQNEISHSNVTLEDALSTGFLWPTALREEIGQDPIGALAALDPQLHQLVDREGAERDLRVLAMSGVAALALALATQDADGWYLASVAALISFFYYTVRGDDPGDRAVRLVALKGLETPETLQAMARGRDAVRKVLSSSIRNARRLAEEA